MPLTLTTARILIVSPTPDDLLYMEDFFSRLPDVPKPDFVVNKFVPADKYDFIVFDARTLPPVPNLEALVKMPYEEVRRHLDLLEKYVSDTTKYIVFFGKYYYNLNQERCPSANSKFTLFARMRELVDFLNHYKTE